VRALDLGPRPHERDRDHGGGEGDGGGDEQRRMETVEEVLRRVGRRCSRHLVGEQDRAHQRDAERAADLAEAVQHARSDSGLVDRDGAHRGGRHGRHRHRHADAAEEQLRQQAPERRVQPDVLVEQQRDADERHAGAHQPARADPVGEPPRDRGDDDDEHGHRQEDRAGLRRREAEDVLHVERDEEEDAEHAQRDEHRDEVRAGERADLEQREVEHRQPLAVLEHHEGDEQRDCPHEEADDLGRRPAVPVALDQRVAQREEPGARGDEAREIDALLVRGVARLRDHQA
jgi:hypothetical protein